MPNMIEIFKGGFDVLLLGGEGDVVQCDFGTFVPYIHKGFDDSNHGSLLMHVQYLPGSVQMGLGFVRTMTEFVQGILYRVVRDRLPVFRVVSSIHHIRVELIWVPVPTFLEMLVA